MGEIYFSIFLARLQFFLVSSQHPSQVVIPFVFVLEGDSLPTQ